MESALNQQASAAGPANAPRNSQTSFPPLDAVVRPTVTTEEAAFYLNRRPQTLRGWACAEKFPEGLRAIRVSGRLAWPVASIKAVLGVAL